VSKETIFSPSNNKKRGIISTVPPLSSAARITASITSEYQNGGTGAEAQQQVNKKQLKSMPHSTAIC
jgi:hypothetical protein